MKTILISTDKHVFVENVNLTTKFCDNRRLVAFYLRLNSVTHLYSSTPDITNLDNHSMKHSMNSKQHNENEQLALFTFKHNFLNLQSSVVQEQGLDQTMHLIQALSIDCLISSDLCNKKCNQILNIYQWFNVCNLGVCLINDYGNVYSSIHSFFCE